MRHVHRDTIPKGNGFLFFDMDTPGKVCTTEILYYLYTIMIIFCIINCPIQVIHTVGHTGHGCQHVQFDPETKVLIFWYFNTISVSVNQYFMVI